MNLAHVGPYLSLTFNVISLAGYLYTHNWTMGLYWTGASIINVSLILM